MHFLAVNLFPFYPNLVDIAGFDPLDIIVRGLARRAKNEAKE
jgi:hypothetical protein